MIDSTSGSNAKTQMHSGGFTTAREIAGQPDLWIKVYHEILKKQLKIRDFLQKHLKPGTRIILTGAGSSAFIGSCLQGTYLKNLSGSARALATTDILSHPLDYIDRNDPHLIISFARSGDSPESIGALEIIDQVCPETAHIIITCNGEGKLVKQMEGDHVLSIILPPESNDQGLAMTGSFTSMLLAGLLISRIKSISSLKSTVEKLARYGRIILNDYENQIATLAELGFERALFLGSGPLLGCAIESHLKLQEMTDGKVICKYDSYLGLRHGPKVVINPKTIVVALLSNNGYVTSYEMDLLADIFKIPSLAKLVISEKAIHPEISGYNIYLAKNSDSTIDEDFLPICMVIPAQLIGFFKSLNLKLNPDLPSVNNTISRVVSGVSIYPFVKK